VVMATRQIILTKSFIVCIYLNRANADGGALLGVHARRKCTLATPITHAYLLIIWT
jgi:hypothetical protein